MLYIYKTLNTLASYVSTREYDIVYFSFPVDIRYLEHSIFFGWKHTDFMTIVY